MPTPDLHEPQVRLTIIHKLFAKFLSDSFNENDYDLATREWMLKIFDCPRGQGADGGGVPSVPILPQPPCPPVTVGNLKCALQPEGHQMPGWPPDQ